jgi:hypothetical protein
MSDLKSGSCDSQCEMMRRTSHRNDTLFAERSSTEEEHWQLTFVIFG